MAEETRKMDSEDRLRAENLQLKLMNLSLQEKLLIAKLNSLQQEKSGLQEQYMQLQKELETKYEVDLNKTEIKAGDGSFVPAGSTAPGTIS